MANYFLSNGAVTNASDNVTGTAELDVFQITEGSDFYNGADGNENLPLLNYQHDNIVLDMSTGNFSADGDARKTFINFENYTGLDNLTQTVSGTAERNTIALGLRNDRVYLSGGGDLLNGGGGTNTLDASKLNTAVSINLKLNTINTGDAISNFQNFVGSNQNDIILGSDSANALEGGSGDDTYFALGGNDHIIDTSGNDLIVGGDGNDSASIGEASITSYATGEIADIQANLLVFTRTDGSTATIYDSTEKSYAFRG